MAENFFVVIDQSRPSKSAPEIKGKGVIEKHGSTEYNTFPEECKFVKMEAESVKEAQNAIRHWMGGDVTTTPIVVKEAGWVESGEGGGSENYFVVFGQTSLPDERFTYEKKFEKAEMLGELKEANFVEIKASTLQEARTAVIRHFPTNILTTPVVVKASEWKES